MIKKKKENHAYIVNLFSTFKKPADTLREGLLDIAE